MYELIKITEQSYYIDCPVKIGVYDTGGGVYLIDSGGDKDAGRRVRRILDERGWKLLGILNTHSHADHIGGNQYLQRQTGCRVFAPGMEVYFTRSPVLEPSLLYGGCPPKPLRHKFLMAQPSEAEDIGSPHFPADVQVVPLPGHSPEQVGYLLPDGTAFIADSVAGVAMDKYSFPYIYDVGSYLESLNKLKAMEAKTYVPSHAPVCTDIAPAADANIRHTRWLGGQVLRLCTEPRTFEEMLKLAFDEQGMELTMQQYVLVGSTLKSFLAWHLDAGRVAAECEDNRLLWRSIV